MTLQAKLEAVARILIDYRDIAVCDLSRKILKALELYD
jgi:hypothetical protein